MKPRTVPGWVSTIINRTATTCAVVIIRGYQVLVAPLLVGGGCRHIPSCSSYAIEALKRHGISGGTRLTLQRLWRCRPGGSCGYDPVP